MLKIQLIRLSNGTTQSKDNYCSITLGLQFCLNSVLPKQYRIDILYMKQGRPEQLFSSFIEELAKYKHKLQ